jgi:hypothetical protein
MSSPKCQKTQCVGKYPIGESPLETVLCNDVMEEHILPHLTLPRCLAFLTLVSKSVARDFDVNRTWELRACQDYLPRALAILKPRMRKCATAKLAYRMLFEESIMVEWLTDTTMPADEYAQFGPGCNNARVDKLIKDRWGWTQKEYMALQELKVKDLPLYLHFVKPLCELWLCESQWHVRCSINQSMNGLDANLCYDPSSRTVIKYKCHCLGDQIEIVLPNVITRIAIGEDLTGDVYGIAKVITDCSNRDEIELVKTRLGTAVIQFHGLALLPNSYRQGMLVKVTIDRNIGFFKKGDLVNLSMYSASFGFRSEYVTRKPYPADTLELRVDLVGGDECGDIICATQPFGVITDEKVLNEIKRFFPKFAYEGIQSNPIRSDPNICLFW